MSSNKQSGYVRVAVVTPSAENVQQQVQAMVPPKKCMRNCAPKLSAGCDMCPCIAGDFFMAPMCNYIGITGMLMDDQCIQFDERYGGCGSCIGCDNECGAIGYCPWNGSM